MNGFTLRKDLKVAGRLQITRKWVWVGVGLIIEYPCAATPNIKRALIRASVDTRNVCGPIGGAGRIGCYMGYIYSSYPAGWPLRECSNTNSSSLDSTYCRSLIIPVSVLKHCRVATLNSNRRTTAMVVIPGVNWLKFLMRPASFSGYAVNERARPSSY